MCLRYKINKRNKMVAAVLMGVAALSATASGAEPIRETVTYQGVLQDGGEPANGMYDIQIQYYDELGNPFVATTTYLDFEVVDGLLSFPIDYVNVFTTGERRFLQIRVRPAGSTVFSDLSPRQELTASPYAVYAIKSGEAEVAQSSLDNEWSRNGSLISSGDTNESFLLNPDLTSGFMINGFTNLQLNFDQSSFGGMYINSVNTGGFPFYGFAHDSIIKGFIYYDLNEGSLLFANNESAGVDLEINRLSTEARNLASKDKIVKDFGSDDHYHSGPVAYGTVNPAGFKTGGTPNCSVSFDSGTDTYTISVDGENINPNFYASMITPIGLGSGLQVTYGTFASGGDLTVRFYRAGTTLSVSSAFQFVIYRGTPVILE